MNIQVRKSRAFVDKYTIELVAGCARIHWSRGLKGTPKQPKKFFFGPLKSPIASKQGTKQLKIVFFRH
jgi:hypothetical protein